MDFIRSRAVFDLAVSSRFKDAASCGAAGWAAVVGSTDIIPMKTSPKATNPKTTATGIVKIPVAMKTIAAKKNAMQIHKYIFVSIR
jgi:hypothetical protein